MRRRWLLPVLMAALILCGCESNGDDSYVLPEETAEVTIPATIPADGNPEDVTCKGSYTGTDSNATAAVCGSGELDNGGLSVWYWAEVAQYRQENHEIAPDFDRPLDTQACEVDSSVNSWQQYFLKQALSAWHTAQALQQHSAVTPLPLEEAYQPNQENHAKYMTGMPATKVLYGYHTDYGPNSMHQSYLADLPQTLQTLAKEKGFADVEEMARQAFGASAGNLEAYADAVNRGYMYFTELTYGIEPTAEELDAFCGDQPVTGDVSVDVCQILLIPGETIYPGKKQEEAPAATLAADGTVTCSEELWTACEEEAQRFLKDWVKKNRSTEATFADAAHRYSKDPGTAVNGGWYRGLRKGQMTKIIDDWCFDPARQAGDTVVLRSNYGVHVLYFSGSQPVSRAEAEQEYYRQQQRERIAQAKETFPLEVTYSAISLQEAQGTVSAGEILYPDIAHERFPEVPLYLQQDYPGTMYGGYPIRTNGCGITSFAMLASYLADDELTPPEMCARYGRYSHQNGTDGMIFNNEPAVLGFYLREKTYDPRIALQALEEGHVVISVQHAGYWTRGGHYIVCEKVNGEGLIQVRDSNIYNYVRVPTHAEDGHKWGSITAAGSGYWIYEHKITSIPACSRCGAPEGVTESLLQTEYICEKCTPALLRRTTYLDA